MRGLCGVVCLVLFVSFVVSVDRSKFKKCSDIGFCRRNRVLSSSELPNPFTLSSPFVSGDGLSKVATLQNRLNDVEHLMQVTSYNHNIWRIRIEEKDPKRNRFDVTPLVISEDYLDGSSEQEVLVNDKGDYVLLTSGLLASSIHLEKSSLSLDVRLGDRSLIVVNERGLLSVEETRSKGENVDSSLYEQWKAPNSEDGGWEESFSSHRDSKPHGPQSVSLDFTFMGSTHAFGLPEHTTNFDLNPSVGSDGSEVLREPYRFYNLDVFEFEIDETMALYGSVPILVSHNEHASVGIIWMNSAETWVDVAKNNNDKKVMSHWISETGFIDVFVLLGPSPRDLFHQISRLTGYMEIPPLFSIAYHQCRWNYHDEEDVDKVDHGFDGHDIPMDVLWLDIEHTDGKRYFTWDKAHFPTPLVMQDKLEKKGRHMVTIVDPHIKRDSGFSVHSEAEEKGYYVKDKNGKAFDGWCWPGSSSWLDYLSPEVQNYWASLFEYDKYEGSTANLFIWNDMNEPSVFTGPEITMQKDNLHYGGYEHREVHNIYGALCHKATRDGLVNRNSPPNQRPFVLSRAFFAGSQRHGAIWTGDNAGEWSHLQSAQPMLLSLGVAGMPFVGADVGGFFGNPEPELLLRWYQAGAFQPFFRGHAHLDTKRREPWMFGDPWTSHIRKAIRTRYAYLPYWYTLFQEASVTGVPPMRPLWAEFPADTSIFSVEDTFMVGSALLVHPIVEAGRSSTKVKLPGTKNFWYDVETYEQHVGPANVFVDAPLEKIPVFQRGGTIIPKRERARRSSTQMGRDPYTLVVALDPRGHAQGSLYTDDGLTFGYTHGEFLHADFEFTNNVFTCHPRPSSHFATDKNVVEKIVILGLPSSKVSKIVLQDESGETKPLTFMANGDSLVVRKPGRPVAQKWSLFVHY